MNCPGCGRESRPDALLLRGRFVRKKDKRTKSVAMASGTLIVYQLPSSVDPFELSIEHVTDGNHLQLTDGADFHMDLTDRVRASPITV